MPSTKLGRTTVTKIQRTGPSANRLDVVVLCDGYTAAEQDLFVGQVKARWAELTAISPYSRHTS